MNRGRSFGPYGCLLFLMGVGFLVAGIVSGMVPEALASVSSNAPDSGESMRALGIWGVVTFVCLGIGSFGLKYYGFRNSIMGFGAILALCGVIGLIVYFIGGDTTTKGNAIWVVFNVVAETFGSLLMPSIVALGVGSLLVIICLATGGDQKPDQQTASAGGYFGDPGKKIQSTYKGQVIICGKCGQENPAYLAVCAKCGEQLSMSKK